MTSKDGLRCAGVLVAISAGYLAVKLSAVLSAGIGLDWGNSEEVEGFLRTKVLSDLSFPAYGLVLLMVNMSCAKSSSIIVLFSLLLIVFVIDYVAVQSLVFA